MSINKQRDCSVNELHNELQGNGNCTVIDVREYPEFAGGRVPGAKLIPLSELAQSIHLIDRLRPVFLICRSGRRSAEAEQLLLNEGFANVRSVAGGMTAWQQAGYPMERDQNPPWSLERQVRLAAGSIVLLSVLLSVLVMPQFIWLAGFVGAGLVFAAITDTCGMAMLLARLPWNRSTNITNCSTK